ncbi:MAG TPA: aldo/keto reductase [Mycobacteriales bacterium]|nr:aldo/keto reductase [Mycobacteriales bacterium]
MSLPTRQLGSTGLEITTVGFGAWAVGGGGWGGGWGDQSDRDSIAAIRHGVEQGVNWIDTAPIYGFGRSEEVVGRALRDIPEPDRPFVFTKCGLVWDPEAATPGPSNVMAAESVRQELEASLRRLGVERIDLYQVHWPPTDGTPIEEYWATMAELREAGKVRAIGLSNHDTKALTAAASIAHVDSVQPPFSLISRETAADVLPWCVANDAGAIVYSPMQSGLLTGAMTEERVAALPADDWRASHDDFTGAGGRRNLALADALRPVAERYGVPVASVAVAWTLSWPGVTGAIVGARQPDQVDGWLPAAGMTLSPDDLTELAGAIRRTGAGSGPEHPPQGPLSARG